MKITESIDKVKKATTSFIVITGGVCSSIGKGVLISSVGVLLKNAGYSIAVVKWDPYLNVDPGTMSPLEHGEVFVTQDGAETDLDLGHYERIIGVALTRESSVSSGQIFQEILQGERSGAFLGRCIQMVPHVVDAIKKRLLTFALNHQADFVLVEIGGTVGDIEGQMFLEAIRQARVEIGYERFFHGHLSYVPVLEWTGEIKTKPTQHSVNKLKEAGIIPDGLFLRSQQEISSRTLEKVAIMCGVPQQYIFQVLSFNPIYKVFINLDHQQLCNRIQEYFGHLPARTANLNAWQNLITTIENCTKKVTIGLIAKYVGSNDPYISVVDAIRAAGYELKTTVHIVVIDAEKIELNDADTCKLLQSVDGFVGPGGFDKRGIEGKIATVTFAREQNIPYLGLCLGLQVMLIEIGRSLVGLTDAHSTEMDKKTPHPVISLLEEQKTIKHKGASMRLGQMACQVVQGTKAAQAYGQDIVYERHRHRYEFNNSYKTEFEKQGVIFSGINEERNLIEIAELASHPFMLGTQFHPEFLSSPLQPHPLFKAFMKAVCSSKEKKISHEQSKQC